MKKKPLRYICQVIVAVILLQTLYFKFSAHPDSVMLFSTINLEPTGRIVIGVIELLLGILLLIPDKRTGFLGALGSVCVISGAIFYHFTKLGIVFKNDGGLLFGLATAVLVFSIVVLVMLLTKRSA